MKNNLLKALLGLTLMMSCSKDYVEPEFSGVLEQRGNDNHKIWKLAQVDNQYDFTLTDGTPGNGNSIIKYVYGCSRPVGRPITFSDYAEENGEMLWDNSSTMSYNNNFMIAEEIAQEYGDEVIRTYHYDSDYKWTGITTTVNGDVLEDELIIGPGGQVKSYASGGVKYEYIWKGDNQIKSNIYVQPAAELRSLQNSQVFGMVGSNEILKRKTKEVVLQAFKELQQTKNRASALRSINTEEWVLVAREESIVDTKVIEPFGSAAVGYPGTSSDAGFYNLSKNLTTHSKYFRVNEDGTPGGVYYSADFDSYTIKDNLPVDIHYRRFIEGYTEDAEGNSLDYTDHGVLHHHYISGCNQGK